MIAGAPGRARRLSIRQAQVIAAAFVLAMDLLARPALAGAFDLHAYQESFRQWEQIGTTWSLWVAFAACAVALGGSLGRALNRFASERSVSAGGLAAAVDSSAVLAWSAFVRFVLTQPNILTDGGSGYGRLDRQFVPGFGGLSVLIGTLLGDGPRFVTPDGTHAYFMWTMLRVPWLLAAFAPPLLVLLARALGLSRWTSFIAGMGLASLPLHAAMYSSDFILGPLLTLELLGLALVAAAVRFDRTDVGIAGTAVLAFACWGRPEVATVGAVLLIIAWPMLARWRSRPASLVASVWFGTNLLASVAIARVLGTGSGLKPDLLRWPELPIGHFLTLQPIIPFWLWVPLPFGLARLALRDRRRLWLVTIGVAAGFLPYVIKVGIRSDPTGSYLEFFRYGTWTLPWILLVMAEGIEAIARFVGERLGGPLPGRARRIQDAVAALFVAVCMATPLFFRGYLSRRYGPRVEEEAFREALEKVPDGCGLVAPDDQADMASQGGGTIEILRRYVYIAEEARARSESSLDARRVMGVTPFLESIDRRGELPPVPQSDPERGGTHPPCWYYFRGSYCYTGFSGSGSRSCAELERRVVLAPVFTRDILYISHRLVTRPDLRDRPLYDPAQRLVLASVERLRAAAPEGAPR